MTDGFRIEKVFVKNLHDFVTTYIKTKSAESVHVLSMQRALSQAVNPDADENDVGLLVAYQGDVCVGYLGLMPGKVKIGNVLEKVYWPSGFFVVPESRGLTPIFLVKQAMLLGTPLILTGMSDVAEKLYAKMGFKRMPPLNYTEISMLKFDLCRRVNGWITRFKAKPGIDKAPKKYGSNNFCRFIYVKAKNNIYNNLKANLGLKANDFYYEKAGKDFVPVDHSSPANQYTFYRSPKAIKWMLDFPWVKSRNAHEIDPTPDYNFSYLRDNFNYSAFRILAGDKKQDIGYAVFSSSSEKGLTTVKLLDHYLADANDSRILLDLAFTHAKSNAADKLHVPDYLATYLVSQKKWQSILKHQERSYLVYDPAKDKLFSESIDKIVTSYCDGDTPFT